MSVATIVLNFPIMDETNVEMKEIVFPRRPIGKDLIGTSMNMDYDDLFVIASRVCNKPPLVFHRLDLSDIMQLNKAVSTFLLPSPKIGEKS
jgi:hypothetical protein